MNASFDFDAPDHFTAGAVGPPGQRVFYLQAREEGIVATLRAEKEQVRILGLYVERLLGELPPGGGKTPGALDLIEPVEAAWAVRTLGLGYDAASGRIVIEAVALRESDAPEEAEEATGSEEAAADDDEDAARARFRISRGQAQAFIERVRGLMRAGRPLCPLCGRPRDADGHVCPGVNGHAVR
jgi:uncharacterized repeat protein (TIGR03847 family)